MGKKKETIANLSGPNVGLGTPTGLIGGAIKAVPAVKYALGVGGIAAVVAIVAGFKISLAVAVFGVIVMLALMFVLVIFSKFSQSASESFKSLSLVLAWTFVFLTISAATLLVTSFFWNWPRPLGTYIGQSVPPPFPSPQPSASRMPNRVAITEASILAEPKILRAFWFDYPHEPEPGRRYWVQVDNNTWLEEYPSGQTTKFRIVGTTVAKGSAGSLLLEVQSDSGTTLVPSDGSFEVFIPDKSTNGTDALFRHLIQGQWREWHTLGEMNVIK
jgi:hypothetical protein